MPENGSGQYVWVIASASGRSFDPHVYEVWAEDDEEKAHERTAEIREKADPEDHITCTLQEVRSLDTDTERSGGESDGE